MAIRTLPTFAEQMNSAWKRSAANCFIVHGNVYDKVSNTETLENAANRMATMQNSDVIAWYSPANGITFPLVSHMTNAMVATGKIGSGDAGMFECSCDTSAEGGIICQGCESRLRAEEMWSSMVQPENALEQFVSLWRTSAVVNPPSGPRPMRVALFISQAEKCFNAESEHGGATFSDRRNVAMLREMAMSVPAMNRGNMLALITEKRAMIVPEIRSASARFQSIHVAMPNHSERAEYFGYMSERYHVALASDMDKLAHVSAGLSRYSIETVCLSAQISGTPLDSVLVSKEKSRIVTENMQGGLTVLDTSMRLSDIGGMPHVKDGLQRMVIEPFQAGHYDLMASGILFVGPAGTGKTITAGALGNELDMPVVLFDFGKLKGKYVGESEAKMENAIALCEALAPLIIFVDEADQVIRRGEKDAHSVDTHAFQAFTTWTSKEENVGRIITVGASNRPDLLDAATLRAGRFDLILLVDMPEESDRREIASLRLKKFAQYIPEENRAEYAQRIAEGTAGMSGAEINLFCKRLSGEIARGVEKGAAFDRLLKFAGSTTQSVSEMRAASLQVCTPEFIPEHVRQAQNARRATRVVSVEEETSERIARDSE
jgi:transitional endoplasmic reticulum ATPase